MATSKKTAPQQKTHLVTLKFEAEVNVQISAPSLEDALTAGRAYAITDLIDGAAIYDLCDYNGPTATGVFEI